MSELVLTGLKQNKKNRENNMPAQKLVIVEDDQKLQEMLKDYFEKTRV